MELGKRLRQARLEAGMSQRQLCGNEITRNMLSQIENGTARPSMATLEYFARRLGKPISFFLEEEAVTSPNQPVMEKARQAFQSGDMPLALETLNHYRSPDPVFDQERGLLAALVAMELAQAAIARGQLPFARELLHQAAQEGAQSAYYTRELQRRRLLLLAQAGDPDALAALPGEDESLLLRARRALQGGDHAAAARYLDAAEDRQSPRWNLLRGLAHQGLREFAMAVVCCHKAEREFPNEVYPVLEQCYRELEDFRRAYEYACKQRKA